jgi:hypothetical protein
VDRRGSAGGLIQRSSELVRLHRSPAPAETWRGHHGQGGNADEIDDALVAVKERAVRIAEQHTLAAQVKQHRHDAARS